MISICMVRDELAARLEPIPRARTRRSSAPEQGASLEKVTAVKGKRLRLAVTEMAEVFAKCELRNQFQVAFQPRYLGLALPENLPERIAY